MPEADLPAPLFSQRAGSWRRAFHTLFLFIYLRHFSYSLMMRMPVNFSVRDFLARLPHTSMICFSLGGDIYRFSTFREYFRAMRLLFFSYLFYFHIFRHFIFVRFSLFLHYFDAALSILFLSFDARLLAAAAAKRYIYDIDSMSFHTWQYFEYSRIMVNIY